jgi:hypothetical protein
LGNFGGITFEFTSAQWSGYDYGENCSPWRLYYNIHDWSSRSLRWDHNDRRTLRSLAWHLQVGKLGAVKRKSLSCTCFCKRVLLYAATFLLPNTSWDDRKNMCACH